jgi:hypothetical protein
MNIDPQVTLAVIAGAAAIATAIWHAGIYVGKISTRIDRHDDRLNEHDGKLGDHDDELRFLKGLR